MERIGQHRATADVEHGRDARHPLAAALVWVPYFDTEPICVLGDDPWPVGVVVTCWEENAAGERRLVGQRIYQAPKP